MSAHPAVMPHGPLEEVAHDVFWVQGSIQMGLGVRITRNMTVVRSGEELSVISAVRLSPEAEAELDRLGTVRHVIKIGHAHGIDDPYYVERYGAAYWALPDGARPTDPKPTKTLTPEHLPFPDAELFEFQATKEREAAILVKRGDGVLITCDAVQHWPNADGCSPLAKVVTRLMGLRRRPAQISPMWRKYMSTEQSNLEDDFARLAQLPFDHLICGHGRPLRLGAQQALQATVAATF